MASRSGMMPPVAVYFVKFCSMARMAAFFMCSGVGKSGSPGPKSAISTPFAFSFSASAMTAAVGEIWMRLMRSVSCTRSPLVVGASNSPVCRLNSSRNFCSQSFLNHRRHQSPQRAAELRDLAHQFRAQIAISFAGQHEHSFQARLEFAIHQRHLQFVLIIGDGANAAQDHPGVALAPIVDHQAPKDPDFYAG